MFLAGGGEFCLTFWSASHIQLYYGSSPWSGGLGVACFAAGMTIARTSWGYLVHQDGLKKLILHSAGAGTLVCLVLPTAVNIWLFFVLIFLAGIATGPFWPSIMSHAADRLPKADSTMLLILLACAGVPGSGFFTYLMGYLGNQSGSLTTAFYLVPVAYALLGMLVAADHLTRKGSVTTESA
jgi:MFS family permease